MRNLSRIPVLCFFFLMMLQGAEVFSQELSFSLAGRTDPIRKQQLDFVLQRYNETRPYLDREFRDFRWLGGGTLGFAYGHGSLLFEAGGSWTGASQYAQGVDFSGTEQQRILHLKRQEFFLGTAYRWELGDRVELVPGVRAGAAIFRINTRVDQLAPAQKGEFERLFADFSLLFSTGMRIWFAPGPGRIRIGPGVHGTFFLQNTDFAGLNRDLNPQTYPLDPSSLPQSLNHLSFTLEFRYFLPLGSH